MNANFQRKTIGQLQVIEKRGQKDAPWIVLFHGFGADAADLAPLAGVIEAPAGTNWLFPEGPIKVPIGPHMSGRAWFNIDMAEIERAMIAGTHRDMSDRAPDGLDEARELVGEMFAELGVPGDKLILGGFSQGAMVATDYALHQLHGPMGLILLSGTLLTRDIWTTLAGRKAGLRYYQCHGTNDPILSFQLAKQLHAILDGAGLIGKFSAFTGGHEIPPSVIAEVGNFLQSL